MLQLEAGQSTELCCGMGMVAWDGDSIMGWGHHHRMGMVVWDGDTIRGWSGCSNVGAVGLLWWRVEAAASVSPLFCCLFPSNHFCLGRI